MSTEIIFEIIMIIVVGIAVYYGFKSGYKGQEKQDNRIKQELEKSEKITNQQYFILRLPLSILLGWSILSFVFSLNGLTIILPYMVNSTMAWNWAIFLIVNFLVGMLVWMGIEKVYLWAK
ncbi:hypothetical protein AKJ58_00960 [candidate division MSBL1 archaeon SCGC-AAA385D11]|uniref:Uncharacterized protein n=1 Tax=candidate division MSBL1 archaeon SCGC-AAA385D11 TaxID=1698286 RepID=A0A133VNU5_9EURY|nr:hypothetical protein AKJ58_00960 [candidate division MSBL1 archaeon SCGC-AAA385D11]